MKTLFSTWRGTVCIVLAVACVVGWSSLATALPTGTQIPIIINLHTDSGISKDDAKKAVEAASKMLKQAGYKLTVVKVNETASAGDAGNDGVIDFATDEWKKMIEAGKKEIEKTPNKKGIKISFVKTPDKDSTTPGWAVHREPVTVVKDRGSAQSTGETIAHEIGHILTLGRGHKIDGSTTANNGGHAPDKAGKSGKENLMAPSNYRTDTNLTADQIKEMKTQKYVRGKCATQFKQAYPAEKEKQQHGAKTDALNDNIGGSGYIDLFGMSLSSLADSNTIQGQLSLGDLFAGDVNATYSLAFDSDNNTSTGENYYNFSGIEYVVEMYVGGTDGNYSATGMVYSFLPNVFPVPLTDMPLVETAYIYDDLDRDAVPGLSQLLFNIDKAYVGLDSVMAGEASIGVLSMENSSVYDSDSLLFDLDKWLDDPTLETFGDGIPTPGEDYQFNVSGLQPGGTFNLFLDERLVLAEQALDDFGHYSGEFLFPTDLPNDQFYFLTAQDTTGEFAYSITCPIPEPCTILLLGSGMIGIVCFRRKRVSTE